MNAKLVLPCEDYLQSYYEACRELKDLNVTEFGSYHDPDLFDKWAPKIFEEYAARREGRNLKPGFVPDTTFWLVEDGQYIGTGNIRHYLTDALKAFGGHIGYMIRPSKWNQGYGSLQLKLLLEEANKLGIEEALLTCSVDNPGSFHVMENNGGVRIATEEVFADGKHRKIYKYLIKTIRDRKS